MGMLGLIHRCVIDKGPVHFKKYFVLAAAPSRMNGREAIRSHDKQLISHRKGHFLEIVSNSVLGLVDIYNLLPAYIVSAPTVSLFQRRLQEMLVTCVREGEPEWWNMFCPRLTLHNHKLRKWRTWEGSFPNDDRINEAFIDPFENLDVMNIFFLSR